MRVEGWGLRKLGESESRELENNSFCPWTVFKCRQGEKLPLPYGYILCIFCTQIVN